MKCDTSETTSYKRSKFEMEDKSNINIPYINTTNNCRETHSKKYQPSSYDSSKFHEYSKEFPPLPTSSAHNQPILIDITGDIGETKGKLVISLKQISPKLLVYLVVKGKNTNLFIIIF